MFAQRVIIPLAGGVHFCGSCNKPCHTINTLGVQTGNGECYGRIVTCTKCAKANTNIGRPYQINKAKQSIVISLKFSFQTENS